MVANMEWMGMDGRDTRPTHKTDDQVNFNLVLNLWLITHVLCWCIGIIDEYTSMEDTQCSLLFLVLRICAAWKTGTPMILTVPVFSRPPLSREILFIRASVFDIWLTIFMAVKAKFIKRDKNTLIFYEEKKEWKKVRKKWWKMSAQLLMQMKSKFLYCRKIDEIHHFCLSFPGFFFVRVLRLKTISFWFTEPHFNRMHIIKSNEKRVQCSNTWSDSEPVTKHGKLFCVASWHIQSILNLPGSHIRA